MKKDTEIDICPKDGDVLVKEDSYSTGAKCPTCGETYYSD